MRSSLHQLLLCISLFFFATIQAQNYTVLGNAVQLGGCECFRITPNAKNQAGAIFQNKTINLNNSFDFTFSVFFGCNNGGGADGLMFALTTNPNGLGNPGEGLGYAGNNQPFSFAVEFDTYQNSNVNDPSYHHIAFNSAGLYNHNVGGPVPAQPNSAPLDDCQNHIVRIVWDVNSNTYSVYLDGNLRLSMVIPNIVQTYFGGNPIVNWGWTAATGGGTNEQNVCIQSISSWVAGTNYQSCSPTIQFTDVSTSNVGSIQSWAWVFGDGGTSSQQNPSHTYAAIGTYNVTLVITDVSGCTKSFSKPVTIAPNITLTPTMQPPPCNGGNNGSITVAATDGFGPSAGYGGYQYSWSTGQNTANAIGLTAGTYSVTVTDGVCTTTGQYTLNQPTALTASITKTDPNCNLANGSATVTVSGGTTPYQYVNWPTISTTNVASNLGAGTYIPDFKDANGCSSLLQYSVTLNNLPCGITSSTTVTDVTCFNGTNGSATLNVTGGGSTKTITWSNGGSGASISSLAAGNYTYNYSDNAGNSFSGSVTISQPAAAMVASMTTLNLSCAGTNDGSALVSVTSGGTPNYNYTWSGGLPNNPAANNLAAANYSVTVTDSKGCTATANGVVSAPTPLAVNITNTIDSCYQAGKGTATANASGGTAPYLFQWSNIASAATNLDLAAGNYTVTVTDDKGCTVTGSTTITQSPAITYSITPQNINCFGDATGSINVTVSGGVPAYTYTWNPVTAIGSNPQNIPAGKYEVTISDAYQCTKVDSVTLTQPDSTLTVTTSHTDVSCFGLNNGTVTINVSGGTAPYSFLNNPVPAGSSTIPNLAPNTYAGNVVDANNCSVAVSETVTEPAQLILAEQHTDVSCFGGNIGSIDITVTGGTTPYTFAWNDANSNEDRAALTQGTYTLTVTDANNCTNTISIQITEPADILLTETHQDVTCFGGNNGSIDVSVTGGATPYTFTWNDANSNEDRTALSQGTYTLTVTDANNCSKTISIVIAEPTQLTVTTSHTDVTCFGLNNGTVTINVSGGTAPYSFLNNPVPAGSSTIPNLAPNTYAGNVVDANNCSVAVSETVTEPAQLILAEQHTDVSCFGGNNGSIDITVTGGTTPYTFAWNDANSNEDRAALTQGTYTLTVTDANNCTDTISIQITEPADILLTETHQDVTCFGGNNGSIDVSITGGATPYTFTWNDANSNEDRTALSQGTYTLTVTDANNCSKTISIVIAEPTQLTVTTSHTDVTCFGLNNGTVTINVSGGTAPYSFLNNPIPAGSSTIPNLTPNTYAGNVVDANNCSVAVSETVTEPAQLILAEQHTDVSCFGGNNGSIDITVTGGTTPYTFAWNDANANEDRTALTQGTYTLTVTDANNCTDTISIQITEPAGIPLTVTATDALCFGANGSATAAPTVGPAPYSFQWSAGNSTIATAALPAGNYTVTSTAADGCKQVGNITINEPTQIIANSTQTNLLCNADQSGTATITASGGTGNLTYTWSPNVSTTSSASQIAAGTYNVTVADSNNCTATISITLNEPTAIQLSAYPTATTCNGFSDGSITSNAIGGTSPFSYTASDGTSNYTAASGLFSNIPAGTYTITATDGNNCTATTSLQVTEPTPVSYTLNNSDVSCYNFKDGIIEITASGGTPGYRFLRDGLDSSLSGIYSGLAAGSYYIEVTDMNGCSATFTTQINEPDSIMLTVSPNPLATPLGNPMDIDVTSNQTGTVTYNWMPTTGLSCYDCSNPVFDGISSIAYTVLVTNANGCTASVPLQATVVPDYTIFIPNFFTPNNDGSNDILNILGNQKAVKEFSLKVFNRWGEKVFESSSFKEGWDGFFNGKEAEPGVYIYHLKVVWIDNYNRNNFKGSITLVR